MKIFIFFVLMSGSLAMKAKDELKMTDDQKKSFEQFKAEMLPKIKNADIKKDIYLIKFFRMNDYSKERAVISLEMALKWRDEEKMDEIRKEDLSHGLKLFGQHLNGVDKEGSPINFLKAGKWPLKDAIEKGEKMQFRRTCHRFLEDSVAKAIEKYEAGGETCQYVLLLDYEGWTSEQGACIECLALVSEIGINMDFKWPGWLKKFYIINSAADFKLLVDVVKPLLNQNTQDGLEIYGYSEKDWMAGLTKTIDEGEIKKMLKGASGFLD